MSPIRRLAVATAAIAMVVMPAAGAASAILPDGYEGPVDATEEASITMVPAIEPSLAAVPAGAAETTGTDVSSSTAGFTSAVRNTLQSMPWFSGGS